jgi:hypothetical protein
VKTRIHIIDNVAGQLAEAEIFDEVTVEHFIETQQNWRPIVLKAADSLRLAVATSSFVANGLDRIQSGGAARGQPTSKEADRGQYKCDREDDRRV